ncbi:MAG: hypothetical protein HKN16_13185 [Saprospiraceae bacterium]|nr:hypothetical protein [Saprospiraceae bacterium]
MLKTKIKASQISNLTDARYFAAWGVDWLGFSVQPGSSGYIDPTTLTGITSWIEGPDIVAEFDLEESEQIKTVAEKLEINCLQLGHFFPQEDLQKLASFDIIQKLVINEELGEVAVNQFIESRAAWAKTFLLDFEVGGYSFQDLRENNCPLSHDFIRDLVKRHSCLLQISIRPDDIPPILELGSLGLSLKGGSEEKVGYKSFDELDELFEALEDD